MKTVYDVLGVAPDADDRAIGTAFRNCAKAYHPDISGGDQSAEEQFKLITAAHALVKSPERRAAYDEHLRLRRQQMRRQRKITIVGCAVSAVISAGLVGVIAPHLAEFPSSRSNVDPSPPTKSLAYPLAPTVGTSWASIGIAADTAASAPNPADPVTAPSRADLARTEAWETNAAIWPEPGHIDVQSAGSVAAVATSWPTQTRSARTAPPAAGGSVEETSASPAELATCMATRPPERQLPASELASLKRRGKEFIANGVVSAARLVFQRAAEACDTDAAFALGATYDPIMLQKLGTRALVPDIAAARAWYEQAKKLGSVEASAQLERLAKANN